MAQASAPVKAWGLGWALAKALAPVKAWAQGWALVKASEKAWAQGWALVKESVRWEDVQVDVAVYKSKPSGFRWMSIPANLMAWLKVPDPAHGLVVTKAARRKVKALLLKLKVPLHALRTTCVLCWLALHGAEQTALHAGVSKVPSPDQVQCSVSRAEAECFFGLTPD